ncbi:amino acid permease [uncultured Clostridium sp.]|jgi:APA family basic amino acid/polyamine antiporter|uniref:APC family permease n=1 Tax=uncultured Clostridium sp. TaxID=59620 RepID=UPI0026020343|nr:amino acid permease [uncultured Clostridium sp.]
MKLFKRQDVYQLIGSIKHEKKRTLGVFDLVLLTVGAVIGTGVLVLPGFVAATEAGPSVILSYAMGGIAAIFIVLCYSEFAASIPTSGGSYSYINVCMGKIFSIITFVSVMFGYILILGFVANGWASYFNTFLKIFGFSLPFALTHMPSQGGIVNLPAIIVVLGIAWLLTRGTSESKWINNLMVIIKITVILLFVIVGAFYIEPSNIVDFFPHGFGGTALGASTVFLAYTGFDITASAAEETINPQKTLPKALLISILFATAVYCAVSVVLVMMVHYTELNQTDSLSYALVKVGQYIPAAFLSFGAIIGILAIIFAVCFGCSRILASGSKDGFVPKVFGKENKKGAPSIALWAVGITGALLGGFVNVNILANASVLALLLVYLLVCIGIIIFRYTNPDFKRGFRTPLVPLVPILGIASCIYLMYQQNLDSWLYFVVGVGIFSIILVIYAKYRKVKNIG